jgi:hypothetical protein
MIKNIFRVTLLLALISCSDGDEKSLRAKVFAEDSGWIYFKLHKKKSEYFAHFIIYEDDKTIAYTANSGVKFRTDITDFEYVKYQKNDDASEIGKIYLKWKFEEDVERFYVTDMEAKDWERIKIFTSDWAEKDKFIP